MGYNIDVAFNILKNSSITETQNSIKDIALNTGCNYFYEDYEYETNVQYKRNHYVITINFNKATINYIIEFLVNIKKIKGLYIETIYDEENSIILYASKYYQTQKMLKQNNYKGEKKKRIYSEEEQKILNIMKK
jgi:hypothetical protein